MSGELTRDDHEDLDEGVTERREGIHPHSILIDKRAFPRSSPHIPAYRVVYIQGPVTENATPLSHVIAPVATGSVGSTV